MNSLAPERIVLLVFVVRGERIVLGFHLAELYGVETRALKQAVRHNVKRFPVAEEEANKTKERREIGFHVKENAVPCRVSRKTRRRWVDRPG